ncbi:hypothetical protein RCZ04_22700 [Capnocytophaga sp. HP1101]
MDFLKKQPFVLQALLLSVALFIGAMGVFAVQFVLEQRSDSLFGEDSPFTYSCIGSITFFVILLAVNKLRGEKFKFYALFYFLWISALYFVCLYYSYGSDWAEHIITYTILFVLIVVAGAPHNIIFLTMSFLLLYLYNNLVNSNNNTKKPKNPFA